MRPLVKTLLFIFILAKAHCLETENLFVNRKLTMLRSKIGRDESRLEGLKFLREMAQIEEKLKTTMAMWRIFFSSSKPHMYSYSMTHIFLFYLFILN